MTAQVLIALRVAAPPEKAFAGFTDDIALWWTPHRGFQITPRGDGVLAFEGGEGGRLITTLPNGKVFKIGDILLWEPPHRLAFTWRQATFAPDMQTRVEVLFEPVGPETRVTVTHAGWTSIPREHVARHGFADALTQRLAGEWWQASLVAFAARFDVR